MAEQAVQTVLCPALFTKSLVATFDTPQRSSDGGVILLKTIDDQLGLTARLAACLAERRQAGKVEHDLPTLIRQRCFALACAYVNANDAAQLRADPIHKLLVGRDPVTDPALAPPAHALPLRIMGTCCGSPLPPRGSAARPGGF